MGCDGGTIPTRDELVRLKKKPEQKNKDADLVAKWKHCQLTQEPLQPPIVACELGRLYKKDKLIEYLLDKTQFEGVIGLDYIRGLKDIKELKLTENPSFKKPDNEKGDYYIDMQAAEYICPITGLEMSGKYNFCYLFGCGCVYSQRALKEIKMDTCNNCGQPYKQSDVIILNGTEEDMKDLRKKMEERRLQARLEKKAKKHKASASQGAPTTADDGPSSSKVPRLDPTQPGPSNIPDTTPSSHDSKLTNGMAGKFKSSNGARGHGSKLTSGKSKDKAKGIQEDETKSETYKSLFNTCEKAKNQPKPHWVTHDFMFY